MAISGTVTVRCPACGASHEATLVQSLDTRVDVAALERLLAGELNVVECACGRRTPLEARLLFHDPERDYFCQACPGGEEAMASGARAFAAIAGSSSTRRLVPSQNALVEKVLILRAGLDDAVIEVLKVLLLASRGDDLDRVLLFARVEGDTVVWQLPDQQRTLASPLDGYTKLAGSNPPRPRPEELRVDRAWAIEAARTMIESAS
jgi:hypothetical protein